MICWFQLCLQKLSGWIHNISLKKITMVQCEAYPSKSSGSLVPLSLHASDMFFSLGCRMLSHCRFERCDWKICLNMVSPRVYLIRKSNSPQRSLRCALAWACSTRTTYPFVGTWPDLHLIDRWDDGRFLLISPLGWSIHTFKKLQIQIRLAHWIKNH